MKTGWRYYIDFVWLPAVAGLVAWVDRAAWSINWILIVVAGFILFTFVEYVVHRWLLHGPLWSASQLKGEDHQRHHTNPQEYVLFPWWYTPVLFWFAWCVLAPTGGPPAFAGFALGGMWFFTIHHAMHHWSRQWAWVERYARWHDLHHKDLPANYGITHPYWDKLFGTYMTEYEGRTELMRLAAERQLSKPWTVDRDARVRIPDRQVVLKAKDAA